MFVRCTTDKNPLPHITELTFLFLLYTFHGFFYEPCTLALAHIHTYTQRLTHTHIHIPEMGVPAFKRHTYTRTYVRTYNTPGTRTCT